MEPFSIECTTCQARLKVRDESAIGQILTCPKCSSMVLVERPVERAVDQHTSSDLVNSAGNADSDDVAAPDSAAPENVFDRDDLTQPPTDPFVAPRDETPHDPHAAAHEVPATSAAVRREPLDSLSDTVEDLSIYGTQQPPPHKVPPRELPPRELPPRELPLRELPLPELPLPELPASLSSEPPLLPTDAWSPASSQHVRNWLMLGGAATIGIFVAVGVFALVAMRLSRDDKVIVAGGPSLAAESPDQAAADRLGGGAGVAAPPHVGDPATTVGNHHMAPAGDDSGNPAQGTLPKVIDADVVVPGALPPRDDGTVADDPPPPGGDQPPGLVDAAASDELPPGFVASGAAATAGDESLDKTWRGFEELLEDKPFTDAAPVPTMADLETVEPGPERPAPRVVDIAARLADTFEEIQFDGTPLNDFLRFVASLSTIPITLDPDALLWLEATPETPVSAHRKTATVQLLVQGVVESVGLTTQVVGDHLLVTLPGEGLNRQLYAIGDLANSAEQRQALAALVTGLVAQDSWQSAGGPGTIAVSDEGLAIQQSIPVQMRVLRFLEKLRVARGLSPTSRFPVANFEPASRFSRVRKQLEKNITLNFFQPTQLDQVTDRLGKSAGCLILIDWQALYQAGWNSDTMVTLTANETPLGKSLDELLEPMGLAYRCVDAGLLQVTSAERLKSTNEFEIYPLGELLGRFGTSTEIMAKLREAMGAEWFSGGGGTGLLAFDAPGNTLLASFPQEGQIRLEKTLAELRAEMPK